MKIFRPRRVLGAFFIIHFSFFISVAPGAVSEWVRPDPESATGALIYKTTPDGDRIMDFSFAGYMGGGVALPGDADIPVRQTVAPLGNGADDTGAIQAAIDAVSTLPPDSRGFRGAVLLAPGVFTCAHTINLHTSGVVLRGGDAPSGDGNSHATIIRMTGGKHIAIVVGPGVRTRLGRNTAPEPAQSFAPPPATAARGPVTAIADARVPSGATAFTLVSTKGLSVGDTIEIKRPTTAAWLALMKMDTLRRNGRPQTWIGTKRAGIHRRVITAIDGKRVTIDIPLSDSYDARHLGRRSVEVARVTPAPAAAQIGVERLHIQCPPLEIAYGQAPYAALRIEGEDCWARDIRCEETMNTVVVRGRRVTLRDVVVTHTYPNLGASKPADFSIEGTQILIDRCRASGANNYHVWTTSLNPGPNVVLNSTFTGRGSRIQPHMRWTTGLLLDNCRVPDGGIDFPDRGVAGSGHGWSAGWSVAWNCLAATYVIQNPPGAANWAIGCIGARTRTARYFDTAPILPEGHFDSHGAHVAPRSLYLAQLAARLGPQALANIGYSANDTENTAALTDTRMAAQLAAMPAEPPATIDPELGLDLAHLRPVNTSAVRGTTRAHGGEKALDGNSQTYWATGDNPSRALALEVDTEGPLLINALTLSEPAALQNVRAYKIEAQVDSAWQLIAEGTTIGERHVHRFPPVTAWKVRLTILKTANDSFPAISTLSLHHTKTSSL
ncbi:discoidin domain-containing protein [Ereboglobus luteus]|uniref:F5/8 type C domain-containing protein n=1 Tax=Ereboglobus luteus TaxID=1796921 RepID=A0A2U8E613_9BACT|nr:discoidin domain-containing protein [Ereboglobus luteus]AWI10266.1 hypothetical protein CKA38_14295 [Ereboglobus luteus]